jgi:hypothetical protein
LRKGTISFFMSVSLSVRLSVCLSVCPSVRPSVRPSDSVGTHGITRFSLNGYSWNLIFEYFSKLFQNNSSVINAWQEWRVLDMKTYVHLGYNNISLSRKRKTFQTEVVEKIKTDILCSKTFFLKSCPLWDSVEKYHTARQATDDNIIRRMRFACWVTKAAGTHSEYVMLIPFPR